MKYTRMYTGSDGLSHFEDVNVPLPKAGDNQQTSELMKVTGVYFRETGPDYEVSWHTADHRQFVVRLEGRSEVIASDGTTRYFEPGDVLLAEDLTGKGHISRGLNNKPGKMLFIRLD